MGISVLVLGHSGNGKSCSLRNFESGEIGLFNVTGKPLPFRKNIAQVEHAKYNQILNGLAQNKLNAYVIDDANYLMAFENFAKVKQKGYDKFTEIAFNFERLLEAANNTAHNTIVYFFMHPDYDETGRMKAKTIGKMLDNQLTVEGMFPIVLICTKDESGYHFITQSDGTTPAKSGMGMFESLAIDNDLKAVDNVIREYYKLAPLNQEGLNKGMQANQEGLNKKKSE